jgi:hypothetical protein
MKKKFKHYAVFINDYGFDENNNERSDSSYINDIDFFEILAKDEDEMMNIIDVMIDEGILIDDEYDIGESIDVFDLNNYDTNLN